MKVLFARIGWMKYYVGKQPGDVRPIGGGQYNKEHIGGEQFNFKVFNSRVYGAFANPGWSDQGLTLERIQPGFNGNTLKDVLIIFISKVPHSNLGQVVVGWHKNSTIYKEGWEVEHGRWYWSSTYAKNAVLLPTYNRTLQIPKGKNSPGQSNVFFIYDRNGNLKRIKWLSEVLSYVNTYEGPNLITNPEVEMAKDLEDLVSTEVEISTTQGIVTNPQARKAIENRAMNSAINYYRKLGYDVKNVSHQKSYDLECNKNNKKLIVEVKGSSVAASQIILTYNEVKLARNKKNKMDLYVLNSIKLTKKRNKYKARGGTPHILKNWQIQNRHLKPIQYFYNIPF
jgi:hypothetical protein